ncbi:magnesium chelatase subunit D [Gemmatimonas sp.]|uniref:magnesium chelatase subunit D n=1 Tax=Gemmatimonas sp. TaxID=1962908 RepID=UPI0035690845
MSSPPADLPRGGPALTALLLAVDARGLGGAMLDHPLHEQARAFSLLVQHALPNGAPLRRVPSSVTPDRLYGGVDLAATLSTGTLVAERGVLAAADGGVIVVPMAERLSTSARTALCEVLDYAEVQVARDGIGERHDARVCMVVMDESIDDEAVHAALRDRLAFVVRTSGTAGQALLDEPDEGDRTSWERSAREARHRLMSVSVDESWIVALCETADSFGIDSVRAPLMALRCARAHAALHGRLMITEADAEVAAALVLAPRATRLPAPPADEAKRDEAENDEPKNDEPRNDPPPPSPPPEPPPPTDNGPDSAPEPPESADDAPEDESPAPPSSSTDMLREAVTSALPPGMLAQLLEKVNGGSMQGRVGAEKQNMLRGRPRGARTGLPRGGSRLHLLETLRAAAPWQRARVKHAASVAASVVAPAKARPRVSIRREDFRIRRFIEKTGTTVLFVVDASGSSAVNRLSEAKGAIEMLLAESYARRDRVSLIAFRGQGTELLLPPTRALARAKRVLAALPGGGGTPLAHAIEAALEQALSAKRAGSAPLVVMLTDGRANIARDGTPGRPGAERDALAASARFAQQNIPALFVDTSSRGEQVARRVAEAMRARYVLLPAANAKALGGLVRTAMQMAEGSDRA